MTTVVSICNMALAHLGDDATVSEIDPPEGSAQAEHCAQFYPIARNALLEMHPWKFAMRRAVLALTEEQPHASWGYAYSLPSDVITVYNVGNINDADDNGGYSSPRTEGVYGSGMYYPTDHRGMFPGSRDFEIEADETGQPVLYTQQADAVIRYTACVQDPNRFPPLFVKALSYLLASELSGPVLKGETGRTVAGSMLQEFRLWIGQATVSDARQRKADRIREQHVAPWMHR